MLSESSLARIQSAEGQLKKPVRLVLFTSDTGCASCPDMGELARALKKRFNRLALETYDVVMDRDKAEQYGVKHVPALVVQGAEGQSATFSGMIEDILLESLLSAISAISDGAAWFPDNIRRTLRHLTNDVSIRVFVESDCLLCRPVAETAIGLGLESALINAGIVVASDFPELVKKYGITTLPKTIFGENLHLDGHVTESEFLEMVFEAEGVKKDGPERKCLVCGNASPDIICPGCKNRIQAEAVDHKIRDERTGQPKT